MNSARIDARHIGGRRVTIRFVAKIAALVAVVALSACGNSRSKEEAAIAATMQLMFDKPESKLVVGPIAVAERSALADWSQGSIGGRALLEKRGADWHIVLCAGDSIKSESALSMAGISTEHARAILAELNEEERSESTERLQLIASFRGVVRMDGGKHPPSPHGAHVPSSASDERK